jgi:hypothetical protein
LSTDKVPGPFWRCWWWWRQTESRWSTGVLW